MSCGQSLVYGEPMVGHLVHISKEDSGCLPLHVDGENQPPLQVVKQLCSLRFTQGPLVHLDATIH